MVDTDPQFKVIVIGEQGFQIINQIYIKKKLWVNHRYCINMQIATIGLDFLKSTVKIDKNTSVTLQIWDTAGQESFKSIIRAFFRGSAAVLLVYSISKKKTLLSLEHWLQEVRENAHPDIVSVLVGSKCDLPDRQVTYDEGVNFIQTHNIDLFFETSAKTGENIKKVFLEATKSVFLRSVSNESFKKTLNMNQSAMQSERASRSKSNLQLPSDNFQEEGKDTDNSRIDLVTKSQVSVKSVKPTKKEGCC